LREDEELKPKKKPSALGSYYETFFLREDEELKPKKKPSALSYDNPIQALPVCEINVESNRTIHFEGSV